MPRKPKRRGLRDPSEASFNKIYLDYRRNAERAGRQFLLTKKQFKRLTKQRCFFCNSPPARSYKRSAGQAPYVYNGLDKIRPDGDYCLSNVRTACWTCNNMKSNTSFKDFVAHVARITSHLLTRLPTPTRRESRAKTRK